MPILRIMSTIASPRPSIALSSRRDSTSTENTVRSASTSRPPASNTNRRNRTALRDYYHLQASGVAAPAASSLTLDAEEESELDRADLDVATYVPALLAREGLEGVLRAEARLGSEIRSLDGEKKALVYDNYSKLIAATETIRVMREKMDPLTPGTSELTTQIARIAETAEGLAGRMRRFQSGRSEENELQMGRRGQVETVRWVLDAPERLEGMLVLGRSAEAQADWRDVSGLLEKWEGVRGVEDVGRRCREVLASHRPG